MRPSATSAARSRCVAAITRTSTRRGRPSPTRSISQGRRDALFVVLGGLAGTAAFVALYDVIEPVFVKPMTYGKPTVATWLGVSPLVAALAGAALIGAGLWFASRGKTRGGGPDGSPSGVLPRSA